MATSVPLPEPEDLTRESITRWGVEFIRTLALAAIELQAAVNGAIGGNVVVLNDDDPLPEGLEAWTLIARSAAVPPEIPLEAIPDTMTSVRGNGTTVSLPAPTDSVADDLLVAVISNNITSGPIVPPLGWVLRQRLTEPAAEYRATAIYTYSVTDEPPAGNQIWTISSGRYLGIIFRVTGADLVNPILANGTPSTRVTNTVTIPDLPGSANGLAIAVVNVNGTAGNALIPITLPVNWEKIYENTDVDGTLVSRSGLTVAIDYPTVDIEDFAAVAASSVSSGGGQLIAIRPKL